MNSEKEINNNDWNVPSEKYFKPIAPNVKSENLHINTITSAISLLTTIVLNTLQTFESLQSLKCVRNIFNYSSQKL
ncbi:hypothetical protein ACPF3S_003700, partial [Vibrio cholerae]